MPGDKTAGMLSAHPTLRFRDIANRKGNRAAKPWDGATLHWTYSGSGAIYQFLRGLPAHKGNSILLPAFHCPTVVEPVVRAGYKAAFYRIQRNLSIDFSDLSTKLSNEVAAVLVINYCGFPAEIDCLLKLREKYGYHVVDDWAHSFLSGETGRLTGERADVSIFSFYKLLPTLAGGGLRINSPEFSGRLSGRSVSATHAVVVLKRLLEQMVDNSKDGIFKSALQFLESKRVALKNRGETTPEAPVRSAAEAYPFLEDLASARMPWFAKAILECCDLHAMVSARRRNYKLLDAHLRENSLIRKVFSTLPDDVCPWAYPVLIEDRSSFDHLLKGRGVPLFTFGELLHPLVRGCEGALLEDAEYLSKNLLMLSIHQNLEADQVVSSCREINAVFQTLS